LEDHHNKELADVVAKLPIVDNVQKVQDVLDVYHFVRQCLVYRLQSTPI